MADRAQLSEAIDQAIRALEELKRVWEAQEESAPAAPVLPERGEQHQRQASEANSSRVTPLDDEKDVFAQVLPEKGMDLKEVMADFEINMIRQALDRAGGTVVRAAELLGMRRTTLFEKMKKYGITARDDGEGK